MYEYIKQRIKVINKCTNTLFLLYKRPVYTVGGMLMVEIFSIAKSLPLTKLFYLEKISMAKSLHIMNLSAVGDKMT